MPETYHDEIKAKSILKLRELLDGLPLFLRSFFRSLDDHTQARTRIAYAYDLKLYLSFLSEELGIPVKDISLSDLSKTTASHIEDFMEYLSYYVPSDKEDYPVQNQARGKSRKLAAVRTLYRYLYKKGQLPANPAELVGFPKLNQKAITTLEPDEIAKLLDEVDSGQKLSPRQQKFHELTKTRDAAIITMLLGTGMRVSECVGLDINHIDFEVNGCRVTRKGGDETILYFGKEVEISLKSYIIYREKIKPLVGHENALFLSLQNRRITDRAVQKLVKKYAGLVTRLKNISPHKLRSTFGTQLYMETGDIYLVANVLGHADVNTTRKHYAKMDEEYRRRAANAVKLRD